MKTFLVLVLALAISRLDAKPFNSYGENEGITDLNK